MVEWSDKMAAPPEHGGSTGEEPMTLIVVNPGGDDGDGGEPGSRVQTAVRSNSAAQRSDASASESMAPVASPAAALNSALISAAFTSSPTHAAGRAAADAVRGGAANRARQDTSTREQAPAHAGMIPATSDHVPPGFMTSTSSA